MVPSSTSRLVKPATGTSIRVTPGAASGGEVVPKSVCPAPIHLFLIALVGLISGREIALAESWEAEFQGFAEVHCLACHDGADAEASLDLSSLGANLRDEETTRRWILIHDRVSSGEMPPPEESPPDEEEKRAALKTLADALTKAERARSDVVLRRLNRREYEHTVRDLFDVQVRLASILPEDTPAHGFDNVGEGLAVSAESMQAYLEAADVALDAVFGPSEEPPKIKLQTNLLDQKGHDGKSFIDRHIGNMFRRTDRGLVIFQSGYCPTSLVNFSRLRPPAGTYRVSFQVRAVQSDDPVILRIYGGDTLVGRREKHIVGYYDVQPGEWTTIEFEDRLVEDGGTFQPKCYGTRDTRKNADSYPEPGVEIADIVIEGPLEPWPPTSRIRLLGDVEPASATAEDAQAILDRVLPLAFRRRTGSGEVEAYAELVRTALADGRSFEASLRLGLKAVLCSPDFLFLDEPGEEVISQYALASRLSYFLWSSMPDAELMELAAQEKLADPCVLGEQVERMLSDPKSLAFTENFIDQWLDLRDIDFTEPDANLYPGSMSY